MLNFRYLLYLIVYETCLDYSRRIEEQSYIHYFTVLWLIFRIFNWFTHLPFFACFALYYPIISHFVIFHPFFLHLFPRLLIIFLIHCSFSQIICGDWMLVHQITKSEGFIKLICFWSRRLYCVSFTHYQIIFICPTKI